MQQVPLHSGVLTYTPEQHKAQLRYQQAVKEAAFLSSKQKEKWLLLGIEMSTEQLSAAEQVIVEEGLKHLESKHSLPITQN